jgi:hypothetical protein
MSITGKYRFAIPLTLTLVACGGGADEAVHGPTAGQAGGNKSETTGNPANKPAGAGGNASSAPNPLAQALAEAGVPGPCGSCVSDRCADSISSCANNPDCVQGFVCTLMQCMTAGQAQSTNSTAGLGCTMTCFQNNISNALLAGSSATCIETACQDTCSSLLSRDAGREISASGSDPSASEKDADVSALHADASAQDAAVESEDDAGEGEASTSASDAGSDTSSVSKPADAAVDATRRRGGRSGR